MVRDPVLRERKIKMVYPRIFWRRCKVCGYEFKQTPMWSWIDNWWWEGDPYRAYACTSCVSSFPELLQHISGYEPLQAGEIS